MSVDNNMSKSAQVYRTADVILDDDVPFSSLMLSPKTLQGLQSCGFEKPSPIQLRAVPLGRCGFDLIVEAKSGTGKTAVFGIIALEMLIEHGTGFQILILAPTREIASQIGDVLKAIGSAYEGLNVEIVMGGTNINEDVERLKKNKFQILVGSPGRILHLIKIKAISTQTVRLLVLDEADKLMEESFQKDINYIYSQLPERKQLIAASATYTPDLRDFLHRYMRTPSHVKPYNSSILLGVDQRVMVVPRHGSNVRQNKIKYEKLIELISNIKFKQCLVFCRYQVRAQTTCDLLQQEGWPAEYLASCQSQLERLSSLKKLQTYSCKILVATDLAARGIDATNVDLIINLDSPADYATYLHRIGRSGRYGSRGTAITIVTAGQDQLAFGNLLKALGNCDNVRPLDFSPDEPKETEEPLNVEMAEDVLEPEEEDLDTEFDITKVNLLELLSLSPKPPYFEPFDKLMESYDEYVHGVKPKEVKLTNCFKDLAESRDDYVSESEDAVEESVEEPFDSNDYLSRKNTDLQYYLKLHLQVPQDLPVAASPIPKFDPDTFYKSKIPLLDVNSDTFVSDISAAVKAAAASKVKTEDAPAKMRRKKSTKNRRTDNNVAVKMESNRVDDDRLTLKQEFDDEDDSDDAVLNDTDEQEYLDFKNRLDMVVDQIKQSVYISTLMKTD